MGSIEHTDSRGTYPRWWDNHIAPQNSKWLQQNLTEMDDNIQKMLDLIKEDGDSFAKRADMFYQRKPKIPELIEQIDKAYRALAERYDRASVALRQVRESVAEASDANSLPESETNELDVENFIIRICHLQESVSRSENEIENLKQCLERAEAERDYIVDKYKFAETNELDVENFINKISHLQESVSRSEIEIENLKQCLERAEAERDDALDKCKLAETNELDVENFINKISNLQESVSRSDIEIENLKQCLKRAKAERDDVVHKYKIAESEAESLRAAVAETKEEKEDLEVAFKKLQTIHQNSAKQFRVCSSDIPHRTQVLDDLDDKSKNSNETGSSVPPFSSELKDQNLRLRDIAKNLEADIEHQVKYQNSLHQEIDRLKIEAEDAKENLKILKQSQKSLVSEKALLEKELSDSNSKIEAFRNRLKGLESSWRIIINDKFSLIAENEALDGKCRELVSNIDDLKAKKPQFQDFDKRICNLEHEILKRESDLKSVTGELEAIVDQNVEYAIEKSVIYGVLAQIVSDSNERTNILENRNLRLELEVMNIVAEREKEASSLVENMVLGSIRELLLEEQVNELIGAYYCSREANAGEVKLLRERINLLEGQNVRLSSVLASCYMTAEEASSVDNLGVKDIKQVLGEELVIMGLTPNSSSSSTQGLLKHRNHNNHQNTPHTNNKSIPNDVVLNHLPPSNSPVLEFWETSNGGTTIDLKVGIRSRNHRRVADCSSSMDSSTEKEERSVVVEVPEKKIWEGSRSARMALERLGADMQKLTNLEITLGDLKRKVDSSDSIRCDEYNDVMAQLEAVEVAIVALVESNRKMSKSMQKVVKSSEDSDGSVNGDSVRKVSEQAWRVGEEIGRQQRKLQSVQWLLVKMDEENNKRGRIRRSNAGAGTAISTRVINVSERKPKVLLKDILHVRVKKHLKKKLKKKKGQFCACVS